jgi:mannose-1-phosphate guanylyltransferase/mannose-6-phosphate isomerase
MPKPFLSLIGDETMFEATLSRTADATRFAAPIVVTGKAHLVHVTTQTADPNARIIVEPAAKNTAAAIALAALVLPPEAIMLVCPSDHHIADRAGFIAAVEAAATLAANGWLVAFGIRATAPETGYGYIRRGEPIAAAGGESFVVAQFVEKPDYARAESFLTDSSYSWNGGIFAFRAGDFVDELGTHRPELLASVRQSVADGRWNEQEFHPDAMAFASVKSESVDYAVMETTSRAAVVAADMAWSDIGNWHALHTARDCDEDGNCVIGQAELVDCRNVLVETDSARVSVIGLEGVMVIVDGNDVLVTTAAGAQKVGKLSGAINQ